MSQRMKADFDWGEVQATIPIFPKNDYLLSIKSIRAQAWPKMENGSPTGIIVQKIALRPEMRGVYDSAGKLQTKLDGKDIAGTTCEEINLWVHSEGGLKQAKKAMMAVLGYNPFEETDEKKFNAFLKTQKVDLSFNTEETEEGGYTLNIGAGYEALLVGKNVKASMDLEIRKQEGKEDKEQQNYVALYPVN